MTDDVIDAEILREPRHRWRARQPKQKFCYLVGHDYDSLNEWAFEGCIAIPNRRLGRPTQRKIALTRLLVAVRPIVEEIQLPWTWRNVKPGPNGKFYGTLVYMTCWAYGELANILDPLPPGTHLRLWGGFTRARFGAGKKPTLRAVIQAYEIVNIPEQPPPEPVDLADTAAVIDALLPNRSNRSKG